MNLPFTNEQLYPSEYGFLWFEPYGWLYAWPDAGTGKTIQAGTMMMMFCDECGIDVSTGTSCSPEPEIDVVCGGPTSLSVDVLLNSMLEAADIHFYSPMHMIHYLDHERLIVLVGGYFCEYFDELPSENVSCSFRGVSITNLTDEQLRKLALWLYDQLGGTQCE